MTNRVIANKLIIGKNKRNFCPIFISFKCFLKYFHEIQIPNNGIGNKVKSRNSVFTKITDQGKENNTKSGKSKNAKLSHKAIFSNRVNFMI